jgi:hypothetical protein
VLEADELDSAPYVVSFGPDHIIGGAGHQAYVRSIDTDDQIKFEVVRPGGPYKDGDTGEILGYEAMFVGTTELQRTGDPATVFINSTERESLIGDRLLPAGEERATANFMPHPPAMPIEGNLISVFDGVSQIGQFNVVVIDRGLEDGVDPGTVLRIDRRGETIRDVVSSRRGETVTLPDEQAGLLMVFRSFERVSFGLVLHATSAMQLGDKVRTP